MIRNPIGTKSEAMQRQRTRLSLRRHIMEAESHGLTMNTENLLQYNPKLADVSHTTRIAYAKFMTTKIKKEIKFEDEQVQIEDELAKVRGARALNKFKANAGILKKRLTPKETEAVLQNGVLTIPESVPSSAISPTPSPIHHVTIEPLILPERIERDFRSRTPIEEESETPSNRPGTPSNLLDDPVQKVPTPSLSPQLVSSRSCEGSPKKSETPTPSISIPEITTSEPQESEVPKVRKSSQDSSVHLSPRPPASPSISISGSDKGKSKISGKTLTGWL